MSKRLLFIVALIVLVSLPRTCHLIDNNFKAITEIRGNIGLLGKVDSEYGAFNWRKTNYFYLYKSERISSEPEVVRIATTNDTRFYEQQENNRQSATINALKSGDEVQTRVVDYDDDSLRYPLATAIEVVILKTK